MAPYPARVDRDTIIQTARDMIEEDGLAGISLNRLAKNLGIKAPSLYHHMKNKTDLLEAINEITIRALLDEIAAAEVGGGDDRACLRRMAQAYRDYARAHPLAYDLLYAAHTQTARSLIDSVPLNAILVKLAGPDRAPDALRSLWALLHGFVELERTGYLLAANGGDVTWRAALEAFLAGWAV